MEASAFGADGTPIPYALGISESFAHEAINSPAAARASNPIAIFIVLVNLLDCRRQTISCKDNSIFDCLKLVAGLFIFNMEVLQTLSVALGLATLSGYSLYLTVFATGLSIHLGWVHLLPQFASLSVLGDPVILVFSGILFLLEFFADKIPWVDSVWDAVHTVIRPLGGAFLAVRALGATNPVFEVTVALLGGAMSFASHSLKASTRLVVNSSPEPFSNIAVSTGENILVLAGVALLWHYPVVVFSVCVVFFALTFYFLPRIWRSISVNLWMIARKLNRLPIDETDGKLPDQFPARLETSFRHLTGRETTVSWAAPCVSGKGKNLDPNRFGYLIVTNEDLNKVYFVTKSFLGDSSRTMEIDKASLEHKLLCEELHLYGKARRFTFKFDHSRTLIASTIAQNLERRLAPGDPLPVAVS